MNPGPAISIFSNTSFSANTLITSLAKSLGELFKIPALTIAILEVQCPFEISSGMETVVFLRIVSIWL